jgi:hypothetical protein
VPMRAATAGRKSTDKPVAPRALDATAVVTSLPRTLATARFSGVFQTVDADVIVWSGMIRSAENPAEQPPTREYDRL